MQPHELSWWNDRWWCSCGAVWIKDDYDAKRHYEQVQDADSRYNQRR